VVLAANSLPAINDITAPELKALLSAVAETCPVIKEARQSAAWVSLWVLCAAAEACPIIARRRTRLQPG
jgi:type II pantothenate kinase